jgi:hypothetical protein
MQWAGFTAARHEAEGDLLYQLDRLDEARQAYQLAVNTAGEDGLPGLTMKVEDLTFAAAAVDQADLDESISDDQPAAVQDAASVDAAEADSMPADTKDNG